MSAQRGGVSEGRIGPPPVGIGPPRDGGAIRPATEPISQLAPWVVSFYALEPIHRSCSRIRSVRQFFFSATHNPQTPDYKNAGVFHHADLPPERGQERRDLRQHAQEGLEVRL